MSESKENLEFGGDNSAGWMQVLRLLNLMCVCILIILNGEFWLLGICSTVQDKLQYCDERGRFSFWN